uniref:Uncharacterized protein n=1 Tax=Anguilla anguilla TaxID=7936 RepID=A0A0E9X4T8_ANGAN
MQIHRLSISRVGDGQNNLNHNPHHTTECLPPTKLLLRVFNFACTYRIETRIPFYLQQGYPTLFQEICHPVGLHSNPNKAATRDHIELLVSRIIESGVPY